MEEQNRIEDRMEEMETEERGTKQAREWLETDPEAEGEAEGMDRKTMKYKRNKDNPRTGKDMRNQDSGKSGRFRLTGCLGAKIVAFFLLALSGIIGFWGLIGCVHMAESGFYEGSLTDVLGRELQSPSSTAMFEVVGYIEQGDIMEAKAYCRERNVGVELIQEDAEGKERVVWSTWDGDDTKYMTEMYLRLQMQQDNVSVDGGRLWDDEEYLVRAHVDSSFPIEDNFRRLAEMVTRVYDARFVLIGVTAAAIFLCILLFVFLMCGAGHQNGREGIVPGVLAAIPLDVLTLVFGFGAVLVGFAGLNVVWNLSTVTEMVALSLMGSLLAVWGDLLGAPGVLPGVPVPGERVPVAAAGSAAGADSSDCLSGAVHAGAHHPYNGQQGRRDGQCAVAYGKGGAVRGRGVCGAGLPEASEGGRGAGRGAGGLQGGHFPAGLGL